MMIDRDVSSVIQPAGFGGFCGRYLITSLLLLSELLFFFFFCSMSYAQAPAKKPLGTGISVEKKMGDLEKEISSLDRQVNLFNLDTLPDSLVLCDKTIPLMRDDVRERFEREYFQMLENRGLLTIIVKRYFQYVNMINEEIRKLALPADLAFLAIAESYLNPRSVSGANAAGMWQFIKDTGQREGLYVNEHIDERFNPRPSTRVALAHLKKLQGEFNDWFLSMAAYNCGAGRVREAIKYQESRDFFDLFLPEETERYILRIASLKEIISNYERYGIRIDNRELYKSYSFMEVAFETGEEIHTNTLARAMEVSYRTFRINNLHIRKYKLPRGTYRVNVPAEKKEAFIRNLRKIDYIVIR